MLKTLKLEEINPLLINLTGIRILVIFSLLLENPKTAEEINEYFIKNNYPNDLFSIDTLRNDLNALRLSGCDISRADKHNGFKYTLLSHPFKLNIDITLAKSIAKLYNRAYKELNLQHLILLEHLFNELSKYANDENTSEFLKNISLIKNINNQILKDLLKAIKTKNKIGLTYKSPNSGKQHLEFSVKNIEFKNKKLYFGGYCHTYENESFLLVSRIISPITFYLNKEQTKHENYTVIYELKQFAKRTFEETEQEKIISQTEDTITIEFSATNKFDLVQKILSYGPNCTVISPIETKNLIVETLKAMREVYLNE